MFIEFFMNVCVLYIGVVSFVIPCFIKLEIYKDVDFKTTGHQVVCCSLGSGYFFFLSLTIFTVLSGFSHEIKVVFFMHVEKYSLISMGVTVNK